MNFANASNTDLAAASDKHGLRWVHGLVDRARKALQAQAFEAELAILDDHILNDIGIDGPHAAPLHRGPSPVAGHEWAA